MTPSGAGDRLHRVREGASFLPSLSCGTGRGSCSAGLRESFQPHRKTSAHATGERKHAGCHCRCLALRHGYFAALNCPIGTTQKILCGDVLDQLIQQAWEMGETTLTLLQAEAKSAPTRMAIDCLPPRDQS